MQQMLTSILALYGRKYGLRSSAREDWVKVYSELLLPRLEERKATLAVNNKDPSQATSDRLRIRRESRRCANKYWDKLCCWCHGGDERCNTKTKYKKVMVALGKQSGVYQIQIWWNYSQHEPETELFNRTLFWVTWDLVLFSFRFVNNIPAGKAKRK